MLRVLGITMFFFAFCIVTAQSPNPFDLKYRPANPPTTPKRISTKSLSDSVEVQPQSVASDPTVKGHIPGEADLPKAEKPDSTPIATSTNPFELNADNPSAPVLTKPDTVKTQDSKEQIKKDIKPLLAGKSSVGFQIFFILLSLLFMIFIVNVERSFVRDLWRVISNENYSSLHHRNQRNTMRQILLLMGYAVFVFQAGLFLFNSLKVYRVSSHVGISIWAAMAFVGAIYLVRHSVIRYLRWLFSLGKELTLFSFDITIFNIMVGLILLPVNVFLLFGPDSLHKPLIIIGLVTIVVAYLMRQLRWTLGVQSLITRSLFLFFIYLCAVEILPLWAISTIFW